MRYFFYRVKHAIVSLYCKIRFMFTHKDESKIPQGHYCYTRGKQQPNFMASRKIIPCPYYKEINGRLGFPSVCWCSFCNCRDSIGLLADMVKICNVNEYEEEEE